MLEGITNEIFEKYRSNLFNYALGLLKQRGSANTLYSEYEEKAKDIVQECYLAFHNSKKDIFVNETHLNNYLKVCLFRCYQSSVWFKNRVNQYSILKYGNLDVVNLDKTYGNNYNEDEISDLKTKLTSVEVDILNYLIEGFKSCEIAIKLECSENSIGTKLRSIRNKYLEIDAEKEKIAKIVANSEKAIIQMDMEEVEIKRWQSAAICAKELNLAASAISNCCKGVRNSHKKFKFKYADESKGN